MKKSTAIIVIILLIAVLLVLFLIWKNALEVSMAKSEKSGNICNFLESPVGSCTGDAENSTKLYVDLAGRQIKVA